MASIVSTTVHTFSFPPSSTRKSWRTNESRGSGGCGNQEGFSTISLILLFFPFTSSCISYFLSFLAAAAATESYSPAPPCPIAIWWPVLNRPLPNCHGVCTVHTYMHIHVPSTRWRSLVDISQRKRGPFESARFDLHLYLFLFAVTLYSPNVALR